MLRQTLMCNSDLSIISHRWVKGHPRPYPNFNVLHQCRNFEGITDWVYEQAIPVPDGYKWKPTPGSKMFDSPP